MEEEPTLKAFGSTMARAAISCSLVMLFYPLGVAGQKADALVMVEDIVVTASGKDDISPKGLAPGTLYSLRVKVRNAGTQKAFGFAFAVKVDGNALGVYERAVYAQAVDPGTTGEIGLYNFYTPDAVAKSGKVSLEITLKEARWVELKKEGGTEVWAPTGDIKGLPVSKSVSFPMIVSK